MRKMFTLMAVLLCSSGCDDRPSYADIEAANRLADRARAEYEAKLDAEMDLRLGGASQAAIDAALEETSRASAKFKEAKDAAMSLEERGGSPNH